MRQGYGLGERTVNCFVVTVCVFLGGHKTEITSCLNYLGNRTN